MKKTTKLLLIAILVLSIAITAFALVGCDLFGGSSGGGGGSGGGGSSSGGGGGSGEKEEDYRWYTVTFVVDGQIYYQQDYSPAWNKDFYEPEVPEREGYAGAWEKYELNGGDKTVHAVYTIIEYTVTFVADDEVVGTATYTVENKNITEPEVPEKENHYGAWEKYNLTYGNLTVKAVYTRFYTVTFVADGEVIGTDTYTANNKSVTRPTVPEKTGYTGTWETFDLSKLEDMTVNAVYTAKKYAVKLEYGGATGGNVIETLNIAYDQAITSLPTPTRTGYNFGGWYYGETKLEVGDVWQYDVSSPKLTAKWLGILEYTLNDDGQSYTVTGIGTESGAVVVPETYEGKPVTAIGDSAFYKNTTMTSISLPSSVTTIGDDAFRATKITSATLSEGLTSMGIQAFAECRSLTSIVIPDSVTTVGDGLFAGCSAMTSVTIGSGITEITAYMFNGCIFTSITIPDNVTTIRGNAFYYCPSLTDVTISNSVTTIENYAFQSCSKLESISLPFVMSSFVNLFAGHYVYIPSTLKMVAITGGTIIPDSAFENCSNIQSITLSDSITSIGINAFRGCSSLENVKLGNGITEIGSSAFYDCSSLTSIAIPASVTSIGESILKNCSKLTSITVDQANTVYHSAADCLVETATGTLLAGCKNSVIPTDGSILAIGDSAFYGCIDLTSIIIPNSVTSIGSSAFYGCIGLTSVIIPDNVTSLGTSVFYGCSGLTSATVGSGISSLAGTVFYDCNSLESITLPFVGASPEETTNTHLGYIFGASSYNSSIHVPESLITVVITGGYTLSNTSFRNCSNIENVTIPASITQIGEYAFYGCNSLTTIVVDEANTAYRSVGNCLIETASQTLVVGSGSSVIPSDGSVTSIADNAFYCRYNLTSIVIPNSVTSIGEYAFRGCENLTSITIGSGVSSINWEMFRDCRNLSTIVVDEANPVYHSAGNCLIETESKTLVLGCANSVIPADNSVTVIGNCAFYQCEGLTDITIPNGIVSIGNSAFSGCTNLTSIVIPDSVTTIGDSAFYECTGLSSAILGSNVRTIDSYAFYGCSSLLSIVIPNSVQEIGERAFIYCSALTSVTIGNSVTTIGSAAFYGCSSLLSIVIPDSLTYLNSYMFEDCTSLTSVIIGSGVTSLAHRVFYNCTNLASVTIGNAVIYIGQNAFYDCNNLTDVKYEGDIASWCNILFYDRYSNPLYFAHNLYIDDVCATEGELMIPDSVTSIPDYAFFNCADITGVSMGDSVTKIGEYAFDNCIGLTSVTIGSNVSSIGTYAFYGCYKLAVVYNMSDLTIDIGSKDNGYVAYYAKNVYSAEDDFDKTTVTEDGYVFFEGDETYLVNYVGNQTELTLPNEFNGKSYGINQYVFYNNTVITKITIPDGVTSIGEYAFYGCSNLTSVTIGDNVTTIGDYAFYSCSNLRSLTLGSSLTTIGNRAFYGCKELTFLVIPNSVTTIGERAFESCSNLISVTVGSGVTEIGSYAFQSNRKLVEVCNLSQLDITVGSSAWGDVAHYASHVYNPTSSSSWLTTTDDGYVFFEYVYGDYRQVYLVGYIGALTELTLPDDFKGESYAIYQYAFYNWNNLTKITMSDGVTEIQSYAFYRCENLTDVTFSANVTYIGDYAFYGCKGLTSLALDSVRYIGTSAFYGCTGLTSLTLTGVQTIGNRAFYACANLESVTLGNELNSIGDSAFANCSNLSEIIFDGTYYQWQRVSKGSSWHSGVPATVVTCNNGNEKL